MKYSHLVRFPHGVQDIPRNVSGGIALAFNTDPSKAQIPIAAEHNSSSPEKYIAKVGHLGFAPEGKTRMLSRSESDEAVLILVPDECNVLERVLQELAHQLTSMRRPVRYAEWCLPIVGE